METPKNRGGGEGAAQHETVYRRWEKRGEGKIESLPPPRRGGKFFRYGTDFHCYYFAKSF